MKKNLKTNLWIVISSILLACFSTTCLAIGPGQVNIYDLNDPQVPSFIISNAPEGAADVVAGDFHVGIWAEEGHEGSYVYFDTYYFFAKDAAGGGIFVCIWPDDKPAPPEIFTVSDGMQILVYRDTAGNCSISDSGAILIINTNFAFGKRINLLTVPKNGYLQPSRIVKLHNDTWIVPFAAGAYPELHSATFEFHYLNNDLFSKITPDSTRFEVDRYTEGFHVMGDHLDAAGNVVDVASGSCTIDVETTEYLAAMAIATSGYDGGGIKFNNDCTFIKPYKATYQR